MAICDTVSTPLCTLPSTARLVVIGIAVEIAATQNLPTLRNVERWLLCKPRTAKKYIKMVAGACGEDPIAFIADVIARRRTVQDWKQALVSHGGRYA